MLFTVKPLNPRSLSPRKRGTGRRARDGFPIKPGMTELEKGLKRFLSGPFAAFCLIKVLQKLAKEVRAKVIPKS